MLLNVSHLNKSFLENVIIKDATFTIDEGSKVAIVGNNGCGKSTLLKMIVGELKSDSGEVTLKKDSTIGYLAQYQDDSSQSTIFETVLSANQELLTLEKRLTNLENEMSNTANNELDELLETYNQLSHNFDLMGGYTFRSEAIGILKGLGFNESDFNKKMSELSGGQKTRVSLGRLLAYGPDLLLLDEPINHLDLNSIMWLEGYLSSYKGAIILVAHDRYFLDQIADHVIDLSYKKTKIYKGNYTQFIEQKELNQLSYKNTYEKHQKEIQHQKEVIEKLQQFNREKSIKRAESRKKLLDKIDIMDAPDKDEESMRLELEINLESGKDVLEFSHVTKSYSEKTIFSDLSFDIHRGQHIAILGANGTGKTTILKVINGLTTFEEGQIKFGSNVSVGYYDQEQQGLNENNTVFSELHDAYPYLTETKIRNVLAAFKFKNDDVFKRISELSGGERGRVSLAKLMLSKANFLILDEPTNHLDMDSKQILEEALNKYPGTLLFVSHDRYFVNKTANIILELANGTLTTYLGNYDDYIDKKNQLTQENESIINQNNDSITTSESKLNFQEQKRIEAEKRKLANRITKIESEIEELENKKNEINVQFTQDEIMTNSAKLNELSEKQNTINEALEKLYEEWELLNS